MIKKKKAKVNKSKGPQKGDTFACGECGMSVVVEEPCGCGESCVPSCCGEKMECC